MSQHDTAEDMARMGSIAIQGEVKEHVEAIIDKLITSKGYSSKFSYPQEQEFGRTVLDFSTLKNLLLFDQVPTIQKLLQLVREVLDPFRASKDRMLATAVPEVEKQLIKELRRIPGLYQMFYQTYRDICELERLDPVVTDMLTPDDCWKTMSFTTYNAELRKQLSDTATNCRDDDMVVYFHNERTRAVVRSLK